MCSSHCPPHGRSAGRVLARAASSAALIAKHAVPIAQTSVFQVPTAFLPSLALLVNLTALWTSKGRAFLLTNVVVHMRATAEPPGPPDAQLVTSVRLEHGTTQRLDYSYWPCDRAGLGCGRNPEHHRDAKRKRK